jgi:hypothetical protein
VTRTSVKDITEVSRVTANATTISLWMSGLAVVCVLLFLAMGLVLRLRSIQAWPSSDIIGNLAYMAAVVIGLVWMAAFPVGLVAGTVAFLKAGGRPIPAGLRMKLLASFLVCTLQVVIFCWALYGFAASI